MSANSFVFPPPPPPPPPSAPQAAPQQSTPGRNTRGGRGNQRSHAGGRGRGSVQQGRGVGVNRQHNSYGSQQGTYVNQAHNGAQSGHRQYVGTPGLQSIPQVPAATSNQAQKRGYAEAFNSQKQAVSQTAVAPAVPSFGAPILAPVVAFSTSNPTKSKRPQNLLGLTPNTEDHESSGDEGVNEESTLAANLGTPSGGAGLQFSYKGKLCNLNSAADIAAWIAERKRRAPTKQRQEEAAAKRAKEKEQAKARKEEATARRLKKQEELKARRNGHGKDQSRSKAIGMNAPGREGTNRWSVTTTSLPASIQVGEATSKADKARQKALKLQRKLERAQKELQSIETEALRHEDKLVALSSMDEAKGATDHSMARSEKKLENTNSQSTPVDAEESLELVSKTPRSSAPGDGHLEDPDESDGLEIGSSDEESDEDTSSSGSSEDSSDDSSPPEVTSKQVVPPLEQKHSRHQKHVVCKFFQRSEGCRFGDKCRNLHEKRPSKPNTKPQVATQRTSLYQRLLVRQREEEDEKVLQYIMQLGDNGLLEDTQSSEDV